jgi:flagellar hook-basal body complex protein FliE
MSFDPIRPISMPGIPDPAARPGQGQDGGDFGAVFQDAVGKVDQLRQEAAASLERFLSGENEELHQAVLATQKAELSFELFLQVRNKVVQAYQEVMRTQI